MEQTEFEKWCAKDTGLTPRYIMSRRRKNPFGGWSYTNAEIEKRYRAYMAGVTSMLPYRTPAKGATNELD